eukprot:1871994-Pleurochrysis_carterae.AAC.2
MESRVQAYEARLVEARSLLKTAELAIRQKTEDETEAKRREADAQREMQETQVDAYTGLEGFGSKALH